MTIKESSETCKTKIVMKLERIDTNNNENLQNFDNVTFFKNENKMDLK